MHILLEATYILFFVIVFFFYFTTYTAYITYKEHGSGQIQPFCGQLTPNKSQLQKYFGQQLERGATCKESSPVVFLLTEECFKN